MSILKATLLSLEHLGLIKKIDLAFANFFKQNQKISEENYCFLAYLFALARGGFHSLLIDKENVFPSIYQFLLQKEQEELFTKALIEGASTLPDSIFQIMPGKLNLKPIVKEKQEFFLQKYYKEENEIALFLRDLLRKKENRFSEKEIQNAVDSVSSFLNQEQKKAVQVALESNLCLISGGPGTGKTYTIKYLLKAFHKLNEKAHVLCMAPTGKATSSLRSKLQKEFPHVVIKTLHQALEVNSYLEKKPVLTADLVIVDECSMVDLHMWKKLLSAVQEGAKIVLVGDYHQLPPVETGMLFEELFCIAQESRVELKECIRIENPTLYAFANCIKELNLQNAREILEKKQEHLQLVEYERERPLLELKELAAVKWLSFYQDLKLSIENLLEMQQKLCLLTPLNKGIWGTQTINSELYDHFKRRNNQSKMRIPILILQTDYLNELFNGDMGILEKDLEDPKKDMAYFLQEGKARSVPKAFLPSFEYAYCITVHKSQGCEFDTVILFLPEKSQFFGKEVLYTAITRAKKSCQIFGKNAVFESCFALDQLRGPLLEKRSFKDKVLGETQ